MSDTNINTQSLMLQMQALRAQAQGLNPAASPAANDEVQAGGGFGELLASSLKSVNAQQLKSSELKNAFVAGDPNVDLNKVMVEAQKASLSFQTMVEVRNKLMEAYKEVTNMPV